MTNITIKTIFIGNFDVGKTMIIKKLMDKYAINDHYSTIGVDFYTKNLEFQDTKVKVHMYDTAGQERFSSLVNLFYKNIHICYIVYDVSERHTYENIQYWINLFRKHNDDPNVIFVLLANKIDKTRYVDNDEGFTYSQNNNMMYYELSSIKPANIDYILVEPIKKLLDTVDASKFMTKNSIVLNDENNYKTLCCKIF